jgi:transcriptional regulator with XRE-family HTH domain
MSRKKKEGFSERLTHIMKDTGTTQQELGDVLGSKRQTVSLYMTGQSKPDVETLGKIADHFNVSADWLLGRTNSQVAEYEDVVDGFGLSAEVFDRLQDWKALADTESDSTTHAETVLRFIDELLFFEDFEDIVENAKLFQQSLSGSIESLKPFIENPERIIDPETGKPDDAKIKADMDKVLEYEYKAKELLGALIERFAGVSKSELWELQGKIRDLCKRRAKDGIH